MNPRTPWRRWSHQRAAVAILETDFWCDKHRLMVIESGADPIEATKAVSIGLYMTGIEPGPVTEACCRFTDDTIQGVLERCNKVNLS